MGQQFSVSKLKVNLKMAVSRMQMATNKKQNSSRITKKQIAELLQKGKEESARIRVEGVIRDDRSVFALEFVSLMCELLSQRIQMIETTVKPPQDLLEACATIIYAANRLQIPELTEIATQLGLKYGVEWARSHLDNRANLANPRVVAWLAVTPPTIEEVLTELQKIADENEIQWSAPKMVAPVAMTPTGPALDAHSLECQIVAAQNAAAAMAAQGPAPAQGPMPPAMPMGGPVAAMPMPPQSQPSFPQPQPMQPMQPMQPGVMPMPAPAPAPAPVQPAPAPMPAPAQQPEFQPPPLQPNAFQPGMSTAPPQSPPVDTGAPAPKPAEADDLDLEELKKRFENLKK